MAIITPIRVNLDCRNRGQYLRWYYNGWHHYFFASADENFNTSGEKYRTKLTYKLTLGDEAINKKILTAISGLVKGKVAQMLTSDGWKAITIDDQAIDYGRNDLTGAGVALSISIWAKVGVYTPMLPVVITPPEPEPVYEWYLPSKDELTAIYTNLHLEGIGGYSTFKRYWTSTEVYAFSAWRTKSISFADGGVNNSLRDVSYSYYTIPVRSFISNDVYALKEFVVNGWVFEKTDLGGGSFKYYVSAVSSSVVLKQFGCMGVEIGSTGELVGTGDSNTELILAKLTELGETNKAAQYCKNYIA